MLWLSISSTSTELDPIASHTRPWALLKKFWRFSNTYGEYQSLPPCKRRQFILDREQAEKTGDHCPESCL